MDPVIPELPVVGPGPPVRVERADAAANRARILEAARSLFAQQRPGEVTMEDIAKAAGVGRATLYRRYDTVAAVAEALLDAEEQVLQGAMMFGDPPLGPGAPPGERLEAFYARMCDLLERHAGLVLGSEIGRIRYETRTYALWRAHVRHLVRESGLSGDDVVADLLLAPLDPQLYLHQRSNGVEQARIVAGLRVLAQGVLAPARAWAGAPRGSAG